jgi:hypothetical protein
MMNCDQCKNRMIEYIEGSLSENLDNEMEQHISQCESCKEYYEREIMVDKAFSDVFEIEGIKFNSTKSAIMNSIDKDKYKKEGSKLMKEKGSYKKTVAVAAVFFFIGVLTPVAFRYFGGSNDNNTAMGVQDSAGGFAKKEAQMEISTEQAGANSTLQAPTQAFGREIVDNYEVLDVPVDTKLELNSTWQISEGFEATIEGKGKNVQEEGIGTIYVKNKENNTMNKFDIKNDNTQRSPLAISWYDNNNLIVVNGLGYGTLINGEEAQLINVVSGEEYLIYRAQSPKERIKSVVREGNQLVFTKAMYDETMNSYKEQVDTEAITE